MKVAKKYNVPDTCEGCPHIDDPQAKSQGGLCFRCPVMICAGDDPLVAPDDYRFDWAEAFVLWFATDRTGLPELWLNPRSCQRCALYRKPCSGRTDGTTPSCSNFQDERTNQWAGRRK